VSDLCDFDATLQQAVQCDLPIGDDEIDAAKWSEGVLVSPRPIWIDELEPGGVSCTTRHVVRPIVDVERRA
jgi:hypothetical protein